MATGFNLYPVVLFSLIFCFVTCIGAPPKWSYWPKPSTSTPLAPEEEKEENSIWDDDDSFDLDVDDSWLKQPPFEPSNQWDDRDEPSRSPDLDDNDDDSNPVDESIYNDESDETGDEDEDNLRNSNKRSEWSKLTKDNDTLKLRHSGRSKQDDDDDDEDSGLTEKAKLLKLDNEDDDQEGYDLVSYSEVDNDNVFSKNSDEDIDDDRIDDDDDDDEEDGENDIFDNEDSEEPHKVFEDHVLLF